MPEFEIVGIMSSKGKDGTIFTTLCLTGAFPPYRSEKSQRVEGVDVTREVTTIPCDHLNVGDFVQLVYTRGYENKARLVAIEKVK